ncbi:DUF928 domain-containing protein [Desmonostoc muscorum CCALA 125]|nr:DUF928 domain-containing protein [Desmonostoc muscorum CCALA 125]
MKKSNTLKNINIIFCLNLLFISLTISPKVAQSENVTLFKKVINNKPFQTFQKRKLGSGAPTGRRRGGAGRAPKCPRELNNITALVPALSEVAIKDSKSTLEATVSEYPTFWVYVPELPSNARFAEFVLQDIDNKKNIYSKNFLLSDQAGIISINLPNASEYSLKIGTKYRWFFTVYCNEEHTISEEYFFVDSYIERVAINYNFQPNNYLAYAEHNIWYDTLTQLAQLYRDRPKDPTINRDWQDLLKSINLPDIYNIDFIEN